MKKNVLKVLLMFVIVAMMFALVACGGGNDKKKSDDTKKDDKPATTDTKTNAEKLEDSITDIIKTVGPILTKVSQIKADSTVGVDVGVGAYVSGAYQHNLDMTVQGNLTKDDPEAKIVVKYGNKDNSTKEYAGIGYSKGTAALIEGLNLINTNADDTEHVKMDVSYLEPGIKNAAAQGMALLADSVSGFSFDLEGEILPLLKGKDADGNDAGLKMNLFESLGDLLTVTEKSNESIIELTKEKLYDNSSKEKRNASLIGTLEGLKLLIPSFDFEAIENTISDVLANYVSKVIPALKDQKFDDLMANYEPSIKIIAGYAGSGESKSLNQIKVAIALNKTTELEIGIAINLNKFDIGSKTNISLAGSTKSLTSTIDANLGVKGLAGKLTAVLNTKDAFKTENGTIATASFALNNKAAVKASYDGRYLKMAADDFLAANGIEVTGATKFVHDFGISVEGSEDKITLQKFALNTLNGLKYTKTEKKADNKTDNKTEEKKEESEGIWVSIYNFAAGFCGVDKWNKTTDPGFDDIAGIIFVKINPYVKDYLTFDIVENGKAKSLSSIGAVIAAKYEANKSVLEDAVYAKKPEAGAYIWGNEGKNLLKFAGVFVKIPDIKQKDANDENSPWVFDMTVTTENGKKVYTINKTTDGSKFDNAFFKHYIEAAFALDDDDAATSYAEWDADMMRIFGVDLETGFNTSIIYTVLGLSYADVVDNGILAYASYDEGQGLSGQIGLKSDDKTKIYVELGASIGWTGSASEALAFDIADGVDFVALKEDTTDEYGPSDALWELIVNTVEYAAEYGLAE